MVKKEEIMPQFRWEDRIDLARMRKERIEKLREEMKKDGIGTYVCFNVANCRYLTDVYPAPLVEKIALSNNVVFPRTGDPILFEWGQIDRRVKHELAPWLKGKVRPGRGKPRAQAIERPGAEAAPDWLAAREGNEEARLKEVRRPGWRCAPR
jgi:Xaa-Pro aminopeptidase